MNVTSPLFIICYTFACPVVWRIIRPRVYAHWRREWEREHDSPTGLPRS